MHYYSNEAVFRGHPDKICDQISDAILDECLRQDPLSRVACETAGGKGKIFITGEITTRAKVNYKDIAKKVLFKNGLNIKKYKIIVNLSKQSPDIAQGVNLGDGELGAGDQGMMFGYATNETVQLLPRAQVILSKIIKDYDNMRILEPSKYSSDGKCQLTGLYDENDKLVKIKHIVFSFNHKKVSDVQYAKMCNDMRMMIVNKLDELYNPEIKIHINPTGKFEVGGFDGDAGLTGRKIIADTYQSFARHGGGAFSGKDATKVDRSGAYKARQVARTIVASGIADRCEVQVAYSIGMAHPLSIRVNTFGTSKVAEQFIEECVEACANFTPAGIISQLELTEPKFEKTARYGHFTDRSFTWEQNDSLLEAALKGLYDSKVVAKIAKKILIEDNATEEDIIRMNEIKDDYNRRHKSEAKKCKK